MSQLVVAVNVKLFWLPTCGVAFGGTGVEGEDLERGGRGGLEFLAGLCGRRSGDQKNK
jgi:hypothetical protein